MTKRSIDSSAVHKLTAPYFQARAQVAHIPAVAYGVVYQGELIVADGFGERVVGVPNSADSDTVFRIASMTKSFCALAILQLRDAGKLRLDDPAVDYVAEMESYLLPTADAPAITVRDLLTMQAGLPQDDPWADRQMYRDDQSISEMYVQGAAFSTPPETRFEYSNLGYMLLGRIISNVSGQGAMAYVTEKILRPLGMHDTVWQPADVPENRLAHGYVWLDETWQPDEMLDSGGDNVLFAGLFTTVADLGRWINLFISAWPPRDEPENPVLKRSSLREMQRMWSVIGSSVGSQLLGAQPDSLTSGYGYGLSLRQSGRRRIVGHGGGLPGFGSYMCWSPDHDIGIIGLGNQRYCGFSQVCTDALNKLIDTFELESVPVTPSADLLKAHDGISHLLNRWDDSLADGLFADNFFLDLDRPHWQARLEALRQKHGAFRPDGLFKPENRLRGSWRMRGDTGWCDVWFSMNPTVPPQVQSLKISSVLPLSADLDKMVSALAELISEPDKAGLEAVVSEKADLAKLWKSVQLAHLLCGRCVYDLLLSCDGKERAFVKLKGEKASCRISLVIDQNGKLRQAIFLNDER